MATNVAGGKAAFFEEGLNRLGKPASPIGQSGFRYQQGWAKGKTVEEAQADLERRWEQLAPEVKDKYAMRAGDGAYAPSEMASSMGATRPTEGVPAMLAKPAVDPNLPADERMNADPAVKAAYEAKREGGGATPSAPREAQVPEPQMQRATPEQVQAFNTAKKSGTPLVETPTRQPFQANPDGQRVMGDVDAGSAAKSIGTRVNAVTGLPFGYLPGAALPADADAAMKQRAADSVARQKAASDAAVPIPKAVAVDETPKPMDTSMFASDRRIEAGRKEYLANEARVAAGSNEGLRAVGPKKPLDELVRGRIPFARRG